MLLIQVRPQFGTSHVPNCRQTKFSTCHVPILKSPYVLEFLDLPDSPALHEKDLENAQHHRSSQIKRSWNHDRWHAPLAISFQKLQTRFRFIA
jgi:hypothetical protein